MNSVLNLSGPQRHVWNLISIGLIVALPILLVVPWHLSQFPFANPNNLRVDLTGLIVMDHSFVAGAKFGTDIVFPYGPYLFLMYPIYWPGLFWYLIIGRIVISTALSFGYWRLLRSVGFLNPISALIVSTGIGFVSLTQQDGLYEIFGPLLLYLYFICDRERSHAITLLLSIAAALISLVKFPFFVLIVFVVSLTAIVDVVLRRRIPLVAAVWCCAFILWWLIAGQSLKNLPAWIFTSFQLGSGFVDAMGVGYAELGRLYQVLMFLFSGAVLAVIHLFVLRDKFRSFIENIIAFSGIALFIYISFKHGVVRHDAHAQHTAIAFSAFAATLLLFVDFRTRAWGWQSAIALCMVIGINMQIYYSYGSALTPGLAISRLQDGLAGLFEISDTKLRLESEYQNGLKAFAQKADLPTLKGTVDEWPDNGALAVLAGYDYRPRPMFMSFSAYSRAIGERNVAFLEGARAPEHILFEVATIDNRLPTMDDSLSWKSLLRHYEVGDIARNGLLILDRRAVPRTLSLVPFLETAIGWDEPLALRAERGRLIWAEIDTEKTAVGQLLSLAYKPPEIWIDVTRWDGSVQRFRMVPTNAKLGFLLSPIIQDQAAALKLFGQLDDGQQSSRDVKSIRLRLIPSLKMAFNKDIPVRLSYMDLGHQLAAIPKIAAITRMKVLFELEASAPADRRPVWVNIRSIPDVDYPVLYAHAPALLSLNIEQQATEVSFGFGMLPGSELGLAGDGVVFRILGKKNIGGDEELLYEKRLDPAHNSSDTGRHTGKASFAAGQYQRLIFETNPGPAGNADYDQAYWSDVAVR